MLSDPKKLRTPGGYGFLVSWRDRIRNLDETKAAAFTQRLLDEPGNLDALRQALGRPTASREDIAEWLSGSLAAGTMVALRTRRKPPVFDTPEETDLRDLVGPDSGEDDLRPETTTWLELRLVDEVGAPLPGVPVRIRAGDEATVNTDAQGVARLEEATTSFGTARISDADVLHGLLRERWSQDRDSPWIEVEGVPHRTNTGPATPLPEVALQGKTPHTLVLQPRVGRLRIVGMVFDTNKAFILPDALGLLRDVAAAYGDHPDATMLVIGHTDTTGEPELNDPLSLDRARAVSAYLTDDVDAWLAFYGDDVSASQRWGDREDALLLERALFAQGQIPTGSPVRAYQEARGLEVDGDLGPDTRRALIEDYMSLDGTTLPASITPVVHGCGESFPLADDGVTLDVDPPDGVDDPTDRRVEVLFFDAPLGILPEASADISGPSDPEFRIWSRRARYTRDMLVVRQTALAVRVTDQDTGAVVQGAKVEFVEGKPSGTTDGFGVRTFINVVAGSHQIRASKAGYGVKVVTHVVTQNAAATIVPLALEPARTVQFELSIRGPDGESIPLPAGLRISLAHAEGGTIEATTDASGAVTLEAPRSAGPVTVTLSLGEESCLARSPDGASTLVGLDEALAGAATGSRFIQLPPTLELPGPGVVLDARVPADTGELDAASLVTATRERPVSVVLAPIWEHVVFGFHDRHHDRIRAVPGPAAEGQPCLVMTGHFGGSETAGFHTAWPLARDGRTVHALAWFLDQGGLPTEEDRIRMQCPPRTYVVSTRDDRDALAITAFPSPEPKVDAPNPDRLLYYDVPERWQCDRYFGRRTGDTSPRPFLELARQTAISSPIVVSLDDIVMMRRRGVSGRAPELIESGFAILDNHLDVYKPNETGAGGYGEPYFTDKARLKPAPGEGSVPGFLLLDAARFTRAIVYRQIFDVFDDRTTVDDPDVPVGARVAFGAFHFESGGSDDTSPFTQHDSVLKIMGPSRDPTRDAPNGRSRAALLRCCGSTSARTEVLMTLQLFRVLFDFFPSETPPGRAHSLVGTPEADIIEEHGTRIQAQALDRAAARWNGTEGRKPPEKLLNPVNGRFVRPHPSESTNVPTSVFGKDISHLCLHRHIFQRHDTPPVDTGVKNELQVNLWDNIRASMSPTGTSHWDYVDLAAHKTASTVAHELGHALGLPDEYGETQREASFAGVTFSDNFAPDGRPYMYDVHDQDDPFLSTSGRAAGRKPDDSSMMTHNGTVRARHFRAIAEWARTTGHLPPCVSIRAGGENWADADGLPATPYKPVVRRLDVSLGDGSLFDAFLYLVGSETHLGRRFGNKTHGTDAILILQSKIALHNPALSYSDALRIRPGLRFALKQLSRRILGSISIQGPQGPMNTALVWSPRILWQSYPHLTGVTLLSINSYLANLKYIDAAGNPHTVPTLTSLKDARSDIQAKLKENLAAQKGLKDLIQRLQEGGAPPSATETMQAKVATLQLREAELRKQFQAATLGRYPAAAQEETTKKYEALTAAIATDHPPHVTITLRPGARAGFLNASATPRTAECSSNMNIPGSRLGLQRLCARLLGASTNRTRLTKDQQRLLVAEVLQGSDFGVEE